MHIELLLGNIDRVVNNWITFSFVVVIAVLSVSLIVLYVVRKQPEWNYVKLSVDMSRLREEMDACKLIAARVPAMEAQIDYLTSENSKLVKRVTEQERDISYLSSERERLTEKIKRTEAQP